MEDRCNNCHGAPHEKNGRTINPKAGLRLDSYEWVIKGNDSGAIVKAGNLEESLIYEVLNLPPDDDLFMPPKGGALPAEQIDIFKRWITEGAKSSNGDGSSTASGSMPGPNEPIDFEKHLMPMIEESCIDCHGAPYVKNGRTIPPKAGLRLDSHDAIIKGNLDGPIVSPGNLEESTIYQVIPLDPDDPEIMPPKEGPWDEEQVAIISEAVGVSAVRFNIVKVSPDKGFTFRWEEALSFEGESAPFIMYSHTRACSIAKRIDREPGNYEISEIPESVYELLRTMATNRDKLRQSVNENKPHVFAIHMLELATAYNSFYRDCHVISDGVVDEFNFTISEKARELLRVGMEACGIIPLESM